MTPPVRALTIVLAALLLLGGATTPASAQKPKIRVWLLRTYVPDANRALEDSIKRWAVSKNLDPVIEYFTFVSIAATYFVSRSEEHTSELQSRGHLVCRLLLEKKKNHKTTNHVLSYRDSSTRQ